ncbi:hypothetical protein EVAR_81842_1 [Eumeta japonica]|uniref:Uncharacterized protein n=1 Tax=Eumeta variegata TaxID=151549 RepID=A0A4C1XVK7_EUMVA|nr:hypothetical protein EVAR_81842_1 [Eumeta japonica]
MNRRKFTICVQNLEKASTDPAISLPGSIADQMAEITQLCCNQGLAARIIGARRCRLTPVRILHSAWTARHTSSKAWVDTQIESSKRAFLERLTTGLKALTGKGRRILIYHIGSEEGFVDKGLSMVESKKDTEDYHHEMNVTHFEE